MTQDIPEILYKYRDYGNKYHRKVIDDNEIYFAAPNEFNDPFDSAIPFRYDPKDLTPENLFLKLTELAEKKNPEWTTQQIHEFAYQKQNEKLIFDENHVDKQNQIRQENFNKTFRIFSLSKEKNNFLMWSHYSDSHKGFCIGYNSKRLFEQTKGQLGPILYDTEFPLFRLFDESFEHFVKYVYTKSDIWSYESEYRIMRQASFGKTLVLEKDTIEEIIFGIKMEQETKFKLLDHIKSEYPQAKVFDTKPHKEKFEIVLDQIR